MRGFGRSCRGQGRVFVQLVRHTARQLLERGEPITTLGRKAQQCLAQTTTLREAKRERLTQSLTTALSHHAHIRQQSTRLTQGKKLSHCTVVNAYDLTIAPILKGKSNGPAQCGRKPGIASDPAPGFLFANPVPQGNPSDPSSVLPMIEKVHRAIDRVQTGPKRQMHSVAGDLGLNDAVLRQALHERGILTVGIAKTIEPVRTDLSAQEVLDRLNAAGFNRKRTPHPVPLACASGSSRPGVESHIASVLSRGAGQGRYQGLEGAVVQQGMTVMAHNSAVLVRIYQQRLSKRAQKFRRLLGLKTPNGNKINSSNS
jgi:hypothetical protein